LDHTGGGVQLETARLEGRIAEQDDLEPVAVRVERARDDLAGPPIAPHRVDRDTDHALGRVEAERLDLATLVRAAVQADVVRPLRLPALRADVDAGRADRMRRAALVAARLRGFPLRNGNDRRPL